MKSCDQLKWIQRSKYFLLLWLLSINQVSAQILVPNPYTANTGAVKSHLYSGMTKEATSEKNRYPMKFNAEIGLLNQTSFTLSYSRKVSFGLQSSLLIEQDYYPQIAFGFKDVLSSVEANWFDVDSKPLEGQFYLSIGKKISDWFTIWGGYSYLPRLSSPEQGFWGMQLIGGWGLGVEYEAFSRFSEIHHLLGLIYRPMKTLSVSVGMLEAQEWFYQKSAFGFYTAAEKPLENAYLNPGVYFGFSYSLSLEGEVSESPHRRLNELTKATKDLKRQNEVLQARIVQIESRWSNLPKDTTALSIQEEILSQEKLKELIGLQKESAKVEDIKKAQGDLIAIGSAAIKILIQYLENPAIDTPSKITSIRVMGAWGKMNFVPALLIALQDSNTEIRRESLLALSQINDLNTLKVIEEKTNDSDEIIRFIAQQLVDRMKAEIATKAQDATSSP